MSRRSLVRSCGWRRCRWRNHKSARTAASPDGRPRCLYRHTPVPAPTDPALRPHQPRSAPGATWVTTPAPRAVAGNPFLDLSAERPFPCPSKHRGMIIAYLQTKPDRLLGLPSNSQVRWLVLVKTICPVTKTTSDSKIGDCQRRFEVSRP